MSIYVCIVCCLSGVNAPIKQSSKLYPHCYIAIVFILLYDFYDFTRFRCDDITTKGLNCFMFYYFIMIFGKCQSDIFMKVKINTLNTK